MPYGLKRYQQSGQSHLVTFSCHRRQPYLSQASLCDRFVESLERARRQYRLRLYGYVVMPEHVHLLLSEPEVDLLATAIQSLKVSFVRRSEGLRPDGTFWQKRYYDHNIRDDKSFVEKLRCIHRNPVKRGLCAAPIEWKWSSFRHYATAEVGVVEIESEWTWMRREGREAPNLGSSHRPPVKDPHLPKDGRYGAPGRIQ